MSPQKAPTRSISESCGIIDAWLEKSAPALSGNFNKPASKSVLANAKKALGKDLPAELVELYGCHNGQKKAKPAVFADGEFLSLSKSMKLRKEMLKRAGSDFGFSGSGFKWDTGWVPLVRESEDKLICLDVDKRMLVQTAASIFSFTVTELTDLASWLSHKAHQIEAGLITYDEGEFVERSEPSEQAPQGEKEDVFTRLREKPGDLEAWANLRDTLNSDDPRRELIDVDIALRGDVDEAAKADLLSRRAQLIDTHQKSWMLNNSEIEYLPCEWAFGHIKKVTINEFIAKSALKVLQILNDNSLLVVPFDLHIDSMKIPKSLFDLPALLNLRHLVLGDCGFQKGALQGLFQSAHLGQLERLDIKCNIGDSGAKILAGAEGLDNLSSLVVSHNEIGPDGAKTIAESDSASLANLKHLDMSHNAMGSQGVEAFASSALWANIQELDLSLNGIGDEGAQALVDSDTLGALATLNLSNNGIGDLGAKRIAESKSVTGLRRLELSHNLIGEEGAQSLAESEHLGKLTSLSLRGNAIGAGAKAIAASDHLTALEALDLGACSLGDEPASAFEQTGLVHLKTLDLSSNEIGDEGAIAILQSPLSELTDLDLSWNQIGPEGMRGLSDSAGVSKLAKLVQLNLHNNGIADAGVKAIAASGWTLVELILSGTDTTNAGAQTIADSETLGTLRKLTLNNNMIGDEGAAALAGSKHLVNLISLDLSFNQIEDDGVKAIAKSKSLITLCELNLYGAKIHSRGTKGTIKKKHPYVQL